MKPRKIKFNPRMIGLWANEKIFEMMVFPNPESRRRAVEKRIQMLREAHDLGDKTAGDKALSLACSLGLSACVVSWVRSKPSRKPSGPGRLQDYQTRLQQWLDDWLVYELISAILEEWQEAARKLKQRLSDNSRLAKRRQTPVINPEELHDGNSVNEAAAELKQRLPHNSRLAKLTARGLREAYDRHVAVMKT